MKILILGWPKSGNTWVSRMVSSLFKCSVEQNYLNDRINIPVHNVENTQITVVKSHHWSDMNTKQYSKVIYVVRDPRDAIVSAVYYLNSARILNLLGRPYLNFCALLLSISWRSFNWRNFAALSLGDPKVGSWSKHVAKALDCASLTIVRYEDLLESTDVVLASVFPEIALRDIKEAVDYNSKENIRNLFLKKNDAENIKFIRSATAGDYKNKLYPSVIKILESRHAIMMAELGYKCV